MFTSEHLWCGGAFKRLSVLQGGEYVKSPLNPDVNLSENAGGEETAPPFLSFTGSSEGLETQVLNLSWTSM